MAAGGRGGREQAEEYGGAHPREAQGTAVITGHPRLQQDGGRSDLIDEATAGHMVPRERARGLVMRDARWVGGRYLN